MHVPLGPAVGGPVEGGLRNDAERIIATAVDFARLVDPNVDVVDAGDVGNEETRVLSEAVAGWCDRYPEVKVQKTVVRGRAGRAIVEESGRGQLLVVGARGRGGFTGLMLGSVSQAALHHAKCAVAVVRHGSWAERPIVTSR